MYLVNKLVGHVTSGVAYCCLQKYLLYRPINIVSPIFCQKMFHPLMLLSLDSYFVVWYVYDGFCGINLYTVTIELAATLINTHLDAAWWHMSIITI